MNVKSFFEECYSGTDRYWWNVENAYSINPDDYADSLMAQLVLRQALTREPGCAIDLGSGEGADAIRLARAGWTVDALELTEAGAAKIERLASRSGVHLTVHVGDLLSFRPPRAYDIVICNGVLHYIEEKVAALDAIRAMTAPGGIGAISSWTDYTPVPECHLVVPTFPDSENGAICAAFRDWRKELLYFERDKPESSHVGMPTHSHSYIKMIAVKP